jgi:tetratricopeptide (TPR) repeat protein
MNDIDILEQQAVDAAINQRWDRAVELNKKILTIDKTMIDPYLRLGFAYMQLKQIKDAREIYNKALKIQPKNQVALDNLERITILEDKETTIVHNDNPIFDPRIFLEVPGKTRSVPLVNLGQKNHLAQVTVGQEVFLLPKKRKVEIRTKNNDYLGSLPDDLSKRLIFFLKAKSKYRAYVQEAGLTRIVIFIQEDKKGKNVAHFMSFPANIQTNLDQLSQEDLSNDHEEEIGTDEDEITHIANNLTEREEEYIEVPQEEDVEEE